MYYLKAINEYSHAWNRTVRHLVSVSISMCALDMHFPFTKKHIMFQVGM